MKQVKSWQKLILFLLIVVLGSASQTLHAQSSSASLDHSFGDSSYNWAMYGTSTITVTGSGTLSESFNMYGTRIFTERDYVLVRGSTTIYSESWTNDETYSSSPGFQVTRTHSGLSAGTYTVGIQAEQRHNGQVYLHPVVYHSITLYGAPTIATPIQVDRTDTSLTISATVGNTGHGITGGRIKIGSTWYTGTVVGTKIYYTKTGLTANTSYTVQAEATTVEGTTQSTAATISTLASHTPGQVTIGDGLIDGNGQPIDPYYAYTYSQVIYLQSEINMPNSQVQSVSFFWNGLEAATASNSWVIYMGHTSASSFSSTTAWVPLANLTQVFSGTVDLPATPGWITITLSTPFSYNNTDNLVVAVDENEAGSDSNTPYFFGTTTATSRGLRYRNSSTNPNPSSPPAGSLLSAYPNLRLVFNTPPTVTTQAVSSITTTTATGNGNVTDIGNPDPTQHGHCWATTSTPTTSNSKTSLGAVSATGAFTSSITGLTPGTLYYVRAYATNTAGTAYGSQVSFTTTPTAPTASAATSLLETGFTANWSAATGATKYYLDVSTVSNFASFVTGYNNLDVGNVVFKAVTGLSAGTTYYYRVRAYNTGGTSASSSSITVLTLPAAPTATAATSISTSGFTANWGTVTSATKYFFDVSTSSSFASFVAGYNNLDVGNVLLKAVTGLTTGTTYYYRVRAYNASGTSVSSNAITLVTYQTPTVTTQAVSGIATTTATGNGNVTALGVPNPTQHGHCWATTASPTTSNSKTTLGAVSATGAFTSSLTSLTAGTLYYVRAYATNSAGTVYGSQVSFTTIPAAPSATAATSITVSGLTANWAASTGATKYYFDVSISSSFASFVTGYNNLDVGNVLLKAVTGLTAGTTYYYRVRAYNASGTSSNSSTITTLTLPSAPTATAATSISTTGFTANWGSVSSATKYYLDVSTSSSFASFVSGYQNLDVGNVLLKAVTGLTTGTTYYYRVRAYNASGSGASSNTITAVTYQTPTVTTQAVSSIATTTATGNGDVTALGVPNPTQHGHCWSLSSNPTTSNNKTTLGAKSATGAFTSSMTGLTSGTLYYVRAYATNSAGTVYGTQVSFTTIPAAPTATAATSITESGFSANWSASTGATSYLLYVSTVSNFSSYVSGYNGLNIGNVTTYPVEGLSAGTTYYYRLKAVNSGGNSAYSNTISTSSFQSPTVLTQAATSITTTTATGNGDITALGNPNPTQYGHCWSTSETPTTADSKSTLGAAGSTGAFTSTLTGLTPGTTYYIRAYATNTVDTSYGDELSFITVPSAPIAGAASDITIAGFTANWAAATGAESYRLDVSISEIFASYISGFEDLDVENNLSYEVTGLNAGTTYYYRVRAINTSGTSQNSQTISVTSVATYTVSISTGNISGVRIYTDEKTDYGFTPISDLVLPAGFSGTFHAEKADYVWDLAESSDSPTITNLSEDTSISFIGTYTYVDPVNSGFVYIADQDIPLTVIGSTIADLVTPTPPSTPEDAIVMVFTGFVPSDLTISVPEGTWYVIAYYDDPANGGLLWHSANPYPAVGPRDVLFVNVPFGAKSDIPIIITGDDVTLPVEFSSFTATATAGQYVTLCWTTQSETNLSGFTLLRCADNLLGSAICVSNLIPATNASQTSVYTFTDSEVEPGSSYYYWLQAIDLDGSFSFHGPIYVMVDNPEGNEPPVVPLETRLLPAFPNPFNPSTTIRYELKAPDTVTLSIYNSRGQLVNTYRQTHSSAGSYHMVFNGVDQAGKALSSGVYYCVMNAGKVVQTSKMVLLK